VLVDAARCPAPLVCGSQAALIDIKCWWLQFWLSSHPPSRGRGSRYLGTHPAVHAGFLRSWLANGLNK
jgi:hypothetical protein